MSVVEDGFEGCLRLREKGDLELVSLLDESELSGLAAAAAAAEATEPGPVTKAKLEAEKAQKAAEESLKKAQAAAAAAAETTKEKAKGWGAKGMGFLSSAFSKAKGGSAAAGEPDKDKGGQTQKDASAVDKKAAAASGATTDAKFSIEEEDEDEGGSTPLAREPSTPSWEKRASGDSGRAGQGQPEGQGVGMEIGSEVNVSHWVDRADSHVFPCKRVGQNGKCTPRYLIMSENPPVIMDVEAHRTKLNVANLKACNQLLDLDKVTFSKKDPNLVTLIFRPSAEASRGGCSTWWTRASARGSSRRSTTRWTRSTPGRLLSLSTARTRHRLPSLTVSRGKACQWPLDRRDCAVTPTRMALAARWGKVREQRRQEHRIWWLTALRQSPPLRQSFLMAATRLFAPDRACGGRCLVLEMEILPMWSVAPDTLQPATVWSPGRDGSGTISTDSDERESG